MKEIMSTEPTNVAENLGKEIEASLEAEQAMLDLYRDAAIATQQFSNSPETLAKVSAALDATYGQTFKELKEKELRLMLQRMTPEELETYKKTKAAKKVYTITEKDLPTAEELEAMGVQVQ